MSNCILNWFVFRVWLTFIGVLLLAGVTAVRLQIVTVRALAAGVGRSHTKTKLTIVSHSYFVVYCNLTSCHGTAV